jgi:hypothetical protein
MSATSQARLHGVLGRTYMYASFVVIPLLLQIECNLREAENKAEAIRSIKIQRRKFVVTCLCNTARFMLCMYYL